MSRTGDKFPGWVSMLDPDPLTVKPPPEIGVCPVCGWPVGDQTGHVALAHPKPEPRRAGCSVFVIAVLVLLSSAPAPVTAEEPPAGEVGWQVASWYDAPGDVAAAPWWSFGMKPEWATVSHVRDGQTFSVTVLIQDFCQCHVGTPRERGIDLSRSAFSQLADPSVGLIRVTITLATTPPPLPQTDTPDQHPCDPPEHPDDARMRLEDRS